MASACSGGDKESFRNVDHDKNGKISYEELLFVFPDVTPDIFARLDTDNDGVLSENEYAVFLKGDASKTVDSGNSQPRTPVDPKSPSQSQGRSGASSQMAVPYKGEEVIEIPAPGSDQGVKAKPEKGKKDSKSKADTGKKGEATQYTVSRGDNLSRIAHKFGLTVEEITRANGNMAPDTLRDGQVLNIPARP
jgi:LysM repeat protein